MQKSPSHFESLVAGLAGRLGVWAGTPARAWIGGVPRGARGLVGAALAAGNSKSGDAQSTVLIFIVETEEESESLIGDLATAGLVDVGLWPSLEEERVAERLWLARRIAAGRSPQILIATQRALQERVPELTTLRAAERTFAVGARIDLDAIIDELIAATLARRARVEAPGEFAVRGGIIDIFCHSEEHPVRIELNAYEVESIRRFDVESQRSLEKLQSIELPLITLNAFAEPGEQALRLDDLLRASGRRAALILIEPRALAERAAFARTRALEFGDESITRESLIGISLLPPPAASDLANTPFAGAQCIDLGLETVQRLEGGLEVALAEITARAAAGENCVVVCRNVAERQRFGELLQAAGAGHERVKLVLGSQSDGVRFPAIAAQHGAPAMAATTLLSADALAGRLRAPLRRDRRFRGSRSRESVLSLTPGDFVVHVSHGIARFAGMEVIHKNGRAIEVLALEFAESTRLLVSVASADLVHRYVGAGDEAPKLAKLGSTRWQARRTEIAREVMEMAAGLLRLQAIRESRPGLEHPPRSHWQAEFEAAFPYEETPDQITSMEAIHDDLGLPRPMDRLLCGDVGYGKTELAMRAAFRAVEGGRQVAMLVPTTVLAAQHMQTFTERMAAFPVRIEVLSRFQTDAHARRIVADLAVGKVDIVIGTHRLLSKDVRFRDLGLVIIDEEQRFGVKHKEQLKRMRAEVDMLAMTATPIPRTLHMAMIGIRDISNLATPPRERLSVETKVIERSDPIIKDAIEFELARDGQVFFVHNRIQDLETIARRIKKLVPHARVGIGHGQMPEHVLEKTMKMFVEGRIDTLVSTTIIESGLDIPNANTILIDEADNFGLSELHQLRGRVGRYNRRAHCLLLVDPDRALTEIGAKRLKAIEEYAELGAGFEIALRDLEIRGAGNVLGPEQSGHIAAVGYELYCRLLRMATESLKGDEGDPDNNPLPAEVPIDLGIETAIPLEYIPDPEERLIIYTRLASLVTQRAETALHGELVDRFGPPPPAVLALATTARVKAVLGRLGVLSLTADLDDNQHRYVLKTPSGAAPSIAQALAGPGAFVRHIDERRIMIDLRPVPSADEEIIARVRALFLRENVATKIAST